MKFRNLTVLKPRKTDSTAEITLNGDRKNHFRSVFDIAFVKKHDFLTIIYILFYWSFRQKKLILSELSQSDRPKTSKNRFYGQNYPSRNRTKHF